MAKSLNKCMIIGNVGRDPEMRYTPDGAAVTSFSVAVSRYSRGQGSQQPETDWFRVAAWNKLAEICNDYLVKGARVYVEGPVRVQTWSRQDGTTGASLEMTARDVLLLSPRADVSSGEEPLGGFSDLEPDDIPF